MVNINDVKRKQDVFITGIWGGDKDKPRKEYLIKKISTDDAVFMLHEDGWAIRDPDDESVYYLLETECHYSMEEAIRTVFTDAKSKSKDEEFKSINLKPWEKYEKKQPAPKKRKTQENKYHGQPQLPIDDEPK